MFPMMMMILHACGTDILSRATCVVQLVVFPYSPLVPVHTLQHCMDVRVVTILLFFTLCTHLV